MRRWRGEERSGMERNLECSQPRTMIKRITNKNVLWIMCSDSHSRMRMKAMIGDSCRTSKLYTNQRPKWPLRFPHVGIYSLMLFSSKICLC